MKTRGRGRGGGEDVDFSLKKRTKRHSCRIMAFKIKVLVVDRYVYIT